MKALALLLIVALASVSYEASQDVPRVAVEMVEAGPAEVSGDAETPDGVVTARPRVETSVPTDVVGDRRAPASWQIASDVPPPEV